MEHQRLCSSDGRFCAIAGAIHKSRTMTRLRSLEHGEGIDSAKLPATCPQF